MAILNSGMMVLFRILQLPEFLQTQKIVDDAYKEPIGCC